MIKVTVTVEASSKEEACALLMRIGNKVTCGSVAGFKMGFEAGNYEFRVEREIDRHGTARIVQAQEDKP